MAGILPERIDFLTDWLGLFNRNQQVDVGKSYASISRNVSYYGSVLARRAGTQIVNGWGAVAIDNWQIVGPRMVGNVNDASGFAPFDFVTFLDQDGTGRATTILSITGTQLTMSAPVTPLPTVGTAVLVQRRLPARIDGLWHAMRRDGSQNLLAASSTGLYDVWGTAMGTPAGTSYAPTLLGTGLPHTTIDATWSSTTTGTFTTAETLVAADLSTTGVPISIDDPTLIRITHAGTVIYEGTIASLGPPADVILSAPASQAPQAGDVVTFYPVRSPSDTRFVQYNNLTFITSEAANNPVVSGGSAAQPQRTPPVKWNGSAVQRVGVARPTGFPTVVVVTPPAPPPPQPPGITGNGYVYRWKYRNSLTGAESEPHQIGTAFLLSLNLANNWVQLTFNAASPDPQVDVIDIYRTKSDNPGHWFFLATVLNVAGTMYLDQTQDDDLGNPMREFLDNVAPDTLSYITQWPQAGRLIAIDALNQQILYSDAPDLSNGTFKPESWPPDNTIFISRDDGDRLTGIQAFFDSVIVFKSKSMWRITGAPSGDLAIQPVSYRDDLTSIGTFAPKSTVADENDMVFASEDGFYQLSRYVGVQQGFTGDRLSSAIDNEWIGRLSFPDRTKVHMVYNRPYRQLRAFVPVDQGHECNEMFVYQFEGTVDGTPHGWSLWSPPPQVAVGTPWTQSPVDTSASCNVHRADQKDTTYYGSTVGLVVQADVGAPEIGALPLSVQWQTVWFSPKGGGLTCRGRAIDLAFSAKAGTTVTLTLTTDQGSYPSVPLLLTPSAEAEFGTAVWGVDRFGHVTGFLPQRVILFTLGEYHRIGFEESSQFGVFAVLDFTYWFQGLPPFVAPRAVVQVLP